MSKQIRWMLLPLLLLATTLVQAETRIGAVNINKLMEMAPQAQMASDTMKARFAEREKDLLKQQETIRQLEERFRNEKDFMSGSDRDAMENQIRDGWRDFKRESDNFTEDFSMARNEALDTLQSDVYKAIVNVAERDGYDLIVSESVLFASKRIDITDAVLEQLKSQQGKAR